MNRETPIACHRAEFLDEYHMRANRRRAEHENGEVWSIEVSVTTDSYATTARPLGDLGEASHSRHHYPYFT
jgi:hypothetical protein